VSRLQEQLRVGRELAALEGRVRTDPADWHAVDALLDALAAAGRWERVREVAAAEMQRLDALGRDGWDAPRAQARRGAQRCHGAPVPGFHVNVDGDYDPNGPRGFAWRAPFAVVVARKPDGVRRIETLSCGHRLSVERSVAETKRRRCVGCSGSVVAASPAEPSRPDPRC